MQRKILSQEWLKTLACLTMLLDHIGASLSDALWLRVVGRIAFPIYCFLLAEGIRYTRRPKSYGLRLLLGAVLAELPFDWVIFGGPTWYHCSVMVTLLLGFLYGMAIQKLPQLWQQALLLIPFCLAAELLGTDYGGSGVALIGLFLLTRDSAHSLLLQLLGMTLIFLNMGSMPISLLGVSVPIELFALFSVVPIAMYSGEKATGSRVLQWSFYLFYPLHLTVLGLLGRL